jgi:hypothetical protein
LLRHCVVTTSRHHPDGVGVGRREAVDGLVITDARGPVGRSDDSLAERYDLTERMADGEIVPGEHRQMQRYLLVAKDLVLTIRVRFRVPLEKHVLPMAIVRLRPTFVTEDRHAG